jgi:hypothetical protein
MPEGPTSTHRMPHQVLTGRGICEHRFDVVCVNGQFVLDLWECRYCGQRIRRKKLLVGRPTGI